MKFTNKDSVLDGAGEYRRRLIEKGPLSGNYIGAFDITGDKWRHEKSDNEVSEKRPIPS